MNVAELKKQIIDKELEHLYVFTGEEIVVRDLYIDKICESSGLKLKRYDSVLDVFKTTKNKALVNAEKHVCVISNDKTFINDFDTYRELYVTLQDNIIILVYDTLDKRSKFYHKYEDSIVEFEKLSKEMLCKYIQRDIALTQNRAEQLAEICDYDYSRILLEIDKIQHYAKVNQKDVNIAFVELATIGIIYSAPYDAIFDFADAVLNRDLRRSFTLLQECRDCGEATLVMLSVLYINFKQLLQVQSYTGNTLAKATGLTTWQINKANAHLNRYATSELVQVLRLISRVVRYIKIGKIEDAVAVDYVLVNIL